MEQLKFHLGTDKVHKSSLAVYVDGSQRASTISSNKCSIDSVYLMKQERLLSNQPTKFTRLVLL